MKSQVFKAKENQEWLNVIVPVSIILFLVVMTVAHKTVETDNRHSEYEQKYIELQSNPMVKQDLFQLENPVYNPVENSIVKENKSAVDNTLKMDTKEYSQTVIEKTLKLENWMLEPEIEEIEEPLELEDWMLNENYWRAEPKTLAVANKN